MGDLDCHLIHGFFSPPESTTQKASWLVRPFLQGLTIMTDRPHCSISNSMPHLHSTAGCSERTGKGSLPCSEVCYCHWAPTGTPSYVVSLPESRTIAQTLRSSNNNLLTVPPLSLALSAKAFSVSGPTVWNSLPNSCKQAELVTTFKCKLKSKLFYLAHGEQPTVYSVWSSPQSASDSLSTYGAI